MLFETPREECDRIAKENHYIFYDEELIKEVEARYDRLVNYDKVWERLEAFKKAHPQYCKEHEAKSRRLDPINGYYGGRDLGWQDVGEERCALRFPDIKDEAIVKYSRYLSKKEVGEIFIKRKYAILRMLMETCGACGTLDIFDYDNLFYEAYFGHPLIGG